jgi:hypothetical protein
MMVSTLVALLVAQSPAPSLLDRAAQVAETHKWSGFILKVACYEWISDHEVIYYRGGNGYYFVYKYDTKTRQSQRLEELTELYNRGGAGVGGLTPSPNGKTLLGSRAGDPDVFYVANIDGDELFTWPVRRTSSRETRYDPTTHTYVSWTSTGEGLVDSVIDYDDRTATITSWFRKVSQPLNEEQLPPARFKPGPARVYPGSIGPSLRFTNVGFEYDGLPLDKVAINTWMGHNPQQRERHIVAFPKYPKIHAWEIAPDGEMILWETSTLNLLDPKSNDGAQHFIDLWVSQWNGKKMRHLGRIALKTEETYWDWHTFGWTRFVVGRNAISFVFRHKLYVVDLE